ncbi:MAG: PRC-barrel domain-containing protein [Candidatus Omnitrophica bacterium]|nr:PRC-barrel domain-containing protein [Candidatus Omnitrophota bacterium]
MIITHNHMVGLPVIDVENGFRLGAVEDLIVNVSKNEVEGVILRAGTFKKGSVIHLKSVHSFGLAALMVKKVSSAKPLPNSEELLKRHGKEGSLVGKKIITLEGEELGEVEDFSFNGITGEILFLSVSGGIIDRALHGTSILWPDIIKSIGPDAVIVKEEAFQAKKKKPTGGLDRIVKEIRCTIKESREMAEETSKRVAKLEEKEERKTRKRK